MNGSDRSSTIAGVKSVAGSRCASSGRNPSQPVRERARRQDPSHQIRFDQRRRQEIRARGLPRRGRVAIVAEPAARRVRAQRLERRFIRRARIVEREQQSERAVGMKSRPQWIALKRQVREITADDRVGERRESCGPALRAAHPSRAPIRAPARAAMPSRRCARRNAIRDVRDTRIPARYWPASSDDRRVAPIASRCGRSGNSLRTRASSQCMCTHECQSKLP